MSGFIVGASYGRGIIPCQSGEEIRGPSTTPAMFASCIKSGGFPFLGQNRSSSLRILLLMVFIPAARPNRAVLGVDSG